MLEGHREGTPNNGRGRGKNGRDEDGQKRISVDKSVNTNRYVVEVDVEDEKEGGVVVDEDGGIVLVAVGVVVVVDDDDEAAGEDGATFPAAVCAAGVNNPNPVFDLPNEGAR